MVSRPTRGPASVTTSNGPRVNFTQESACRSRGVIPRRRSLRHIKSIIPYGRPPGRPCLPAGVTAAGATCYLRLTGKCRPGGRHYGSQFFVLVRRDEVHTCGDGGLPAQHGGFVGAEVIAVSPAFV